MKFSNIFTDTSKARSFVAGTSIFEKGDQGREMYVVKEGEVDIVIDDFHFETVLPDGIFGELSLIDQETRIASAIARTDCTLQVIDKRQFLFLVQETPLFAIQVMAEMANRLRGVDLLIAKRGAES
jgi:CRP/FNR family transcriptional regulator, cyclic AMP receptor protein